jgi:ribonuclease D
MYPSTIDSEELKKLPKGAFEGEIHLIDTPAGVNKFMPVLMQENLLGFDIEARPAFRKGSKNKPSLMQVSTRFHAFLFRLGAIGMPDPVIRLLENRDILKIGAAVRDDLVDLNEVRRFKPAGFLDLQKYVEAFGIESKAVAKMAGIVLGIRISKSQQLSNWDAEVLSGAQLLYAATDAWVCYRIYAELQKFRSR